MEGLALMFVGSLDNSKNIWLIVLATILMTGDYAHATVQIYRSPGQANFNASITATALDPVSNTLYVSSAGDGPYALASSSMLALNFTPLATAASLNGKNIGGMSLFAPSCGQATDIVGFINNASLTPQQLFLLPFDGSAPSFSNTLYDAASAQASSITKIATNSSCVFARVLGSLAIPVIQAPASEPRYSGIATLSSSLTINQGSALTPAALLDYTSPQAYQGSPLTSLIVQDLTWNTELEELYAGMLIIAPATAGGTNVGYGIVHGSASSTCTLTLSAITTSAPAAGSNQGIFAVRPTVANTNDGVNIKHIAAMNASTGLNYLIINGGIFSSQAYIATNQDGLLNPINQQATSDASGNLIYALPLGSSPQSSSSAPNATAGSIVQNTAISAEMSLCCGQTCSPCVGASIPTLALPLPSDFTLTECAFDVGGGSAPWQAAVTGTYIGQNIAYYNRTADNQVVSNIEDPSSGDANGNANAGYTFLLKLVANASSIQLTQQASDMHVIGDAVYVSSGAQTNLTPIIIPANFQGSGNVERVITASVCVNIDRSGANDTGVWVSQAMFDNAGALTGWSIWERAFPTTGDGDLDKTTFFQVDGKTAQVWQIQGNPQAYCSGNATTVFRTSWVTEDTTAGSLMEEISVAFVTDQSCPQLAGTFSALDLPGATGGTSGTPGLSGSTSYMLFGGFARVAFARMRQEQNVTTDPLAFNNPANFLLTEMPCTASTVRVLGYSYIPTTSASTRNVFFAGTDTGLFAYASADGLGFETGTTLLTALNAAPFAPESDTWFLIPKTDSLAISALQSDNGNTLYFIAQDTQSCQCTINDALYKIDLTSLSSTPVTALSIEKIAQSGMSGLPVNATINGFVVLSDPCQTASPHYYGLIATNDGLYASTKPLSSLDFSTGEWQIIDRTSCLAYNVLQSPLKLYDPATNNARNKAFGAYFVDNGAPISGANYQNVFQNSSIIQIGNAGTLFGAHPDFDEQAASTRRFFLNDNKSISALNFTLALWSDGARRLFAQTYTNNCNASQIASLPYDGCAYNMSQSFIDPSLNEIFSINWILNSSGSGQLFAGTNTGIIAIE